MTAAETTMCSPDRAARATDTEGAIARADDGSGGLRDGQNRALRQLARGAPLDMVLDTLVRSAEAVVPGMIGSILLIEDGRLRNGAAPSLPAWYCEALEGGLVGPSAGSCGTAAYRKQRVVVSDIRTDPLWDDYRELAERAGLRACWSEPVFGSDGGCIGTFGMYYRTAKMPSPSDLALIENAAQVAGIAIERHRDEARLRDATRRAEAASRAKSRFLAHMSHELRTPLNAIIGFADLLDSEAFGPIGGDRNRSYARDIARSGRHLLDIVTGLLDLSRLEAGAPPAIATVDVPGLIEDLETALSEKARERGVTIETRYRCGGCEVATDASALRHALANLLDNAVKYSPAGGRVVIEVAEAATLDATPGTAPGASSETNADCVAIRITDCGDGIAPDLLPHIRDAFALSGRMTARTGAGFGCGLAIADRLVRMLHGRLDIESTLGIGTSVTVRLPRHPDEAPQSPAEDGAEGEVADGAEAM